MKSRGTPVNKLTINLVTNESPRFSRACHNCNLSVRYAIRNQEAFLFNINKTYEFHWLGKTFNINIMKIHIENKARRRYENLTRRSSTFVMLEAFKKMFLVKLINVLFNFKQLKCIIIFFLPAYRFSID